MSEEVDITTAEIVGEGLGWVNGSGRRHHEQRRQGRKICWRSVGVGDSGIPHQRGRWGLKRPMAARASAFGVVGFWDVSGVGDGSGKPLFVVLMESGTAGASGTASLYFWFFPDIMGGGFGVGSAFKWLEAAGFLASGGNDDGGN